MPKSNNGLNRIDAWSGTHLSGSFALAMDFIGCAGAGLCLGGLL